MFRQSTNQNRVVMTSLDGINGWSIQTWLRGENDWKQSDEILPPPPPPPASFLLFALVLTFSTNSRGEACYAGYKNTNTTPYCTTLNP